MHALTKYHEAKSAQKQAERDLQLIGQPYRGGGGGTGKITSLDVAITIYHQYRDGATNYHGENGPLNAALSKAAMEMAGDLIARARTLLQADVDAARDAAKAEYEAEFAKADAVPPDDASSAVRAA